jgi:hypothetical protein
MARPRLHDDGFLEFLRQKPCCCGCGRPPQSQAAHVRINFFAMAKKPDDRFAVPLNQWCHLDAPDSQHKNEKLFWKRRGLDPFAIAARLYAEYGGTGGKPRQKRKRTTIKPKGFGQKIRTKTTWTKGRKIPNRKFAASWKSGCTAD